MDNHPSNQTDTTSDDEKTFINIVDNVSFLFKLCDKVKFMFSKRATKIDEILTAVLTLTTYCQIDGEDFVNCCGLLRKCEH